jgi:dihydroxyacetone kinase-like predicted kinase
VDSDKIIDTVAESLKEFNPEFITIYIGEGVSEAEAIATASRIEAIISDTEIEIINGGQPIYHYIISVE